MRLKNRVLTLKRLIIPDKGQYNIVEVDGDSIRVREDNSPDQIAVKTGWD